MDQGPSVGIFYLLIVITCDFSRFFVIQTTSAGKKDLQYLDAHKIMYNETCAPSSRFTIERWAMFEEDFKMRLGAQ